MKTWLIGRSRECDVVLPHASVSSRHALLEIDADGRCLLRDNSSTNGTYLNSPDHRIEAAEVKDDDIVFFSRHFSIPVSALKARLQPGGSGDDSGSGPAEPVEVRKEVIRIGRSADNDIVIPRLEVSRHHAEIRHLPGGGAEIADLGSKSGTYVNNRLLRGGSLPVTSQDRIEIAGELVSFQLSSDGGRNARVGVARQGIFLQARELGVEVPGSDARTPRVLLAGIDLAIYPGEFVGLMGPSGCGKTTLLNALVGFVPPASGRVLYDGLDLARNRDRYGLQIGYVPQDDLLHPELTVREVLYFNARIKLPLDVTDDEIHRKIDDICRKLGLYQPQNGLDVRDVPIGSPERKGLSGGQKKRVSLAIELLTDPKILFLDEPTSGLSSRDARLVVELLRRLVDERGISVVMTIHQPSLRVYEQLHKVIYLKQGRLCYFGPSFPESVEYFEPGANPREAGPDIVMERLDEKPEAEWQEQFRHSPFYRTYVEERHSRIGTRDASGAPLPHRGTPPLVQFAKLLQRAAICRLRDTLSTVILIAQAPLVAVLIALIFDPEHAADRSTAVFLLGFVSIWFGVNNSVREIVGEQAILRRERRAGLSAAAYLASKTCVQGGITFVQCLSLVGIAAVWQSDLGLHFFGAFLVCWLGSLVGIGIGLAISAVARTQIAAIVAVPLVLIPIILLGGLVKPFNELVDRGLLAWLSDLTPARWTFEALSTQAAVPSFFFNKDSLTESLSVPVLLVMAALCHLVAYLRVRGIDSSR